MAGLPTRTKGYSDYMGLAIPPCGDFEQMRTSIPTSTSPWSQNSQKPPETLSLEIKHFLKYMTPSDREIAIRQDLIHRFTSLIESIDDTATVVPVGSSLTGLCLPTSDIDMVLWPRVLRSSTYTNVTVESLYPKILRSGFASGIETVFCASVPVMKVTDKLTGIEIDLSDAGSRGIKATKAVLKWIKKDKDIVKMLFFVVKTFLMVRRCGSTYTGGINSYVLVWMIVAWVNLEWPTIKGNQTRPKTSGDDHPSSILESFGNLSLLPERTSPANRTGPKHSPESEYGEALKGFLSFYGNHFDYYSCAIDIEPKPSYKTKAYVYARYTTQRYLLSIFDPADASVDLGSKAYGINHIKASFQEAYSVISKSGHSDRSLTVMLGGDFTTFVKKRQDLAKRGET